MSLITVFLLFANLILALSLCGLVQDASLFQTQICRAILTFVTFNNSRRT